MRNQALFKKGEIQRAGKNPFDGIFFYPRRGPSHKSGEEKTSRKTSGRRSYAFKE